MKRLVLALAFCACGPDFEPCDPAKVTILPDGGITNCIGYTLPDAPDAGAPDPTPSPACDPARDPACRP